MLRVVASFVIAAYNNICCIPCGFARLACELFMKLFETGKIANTNQGALTIRPDFIQLVQTRIFRTIPFLTDRTR
jgi:hypothetical protein